MKKDYATWPTSFCAAAVALAAAPPLPRGMTGGSLPLPGIGEVKVS